jgi:hypothetical protein
VRPILGWLVDLTDVAAMARPMTLQGLGGDIFDTVALDAREANFLGALPPHETLEDRDELWHRVANAAWEEWSRSAPLRAKT